MSYKKIFWGVILILIGSLFILKNLGLIYFDWGMILSMWPLVLILWGISILPFKSGIKLILSLASIVIAFLVVNRYEERVYDGYGLWDKGIEFNFDGDRNWEDKEYNTYQWEQDQKLTAEYKDKKHASLNFNAGAGEFVISESSEDYLATFLRKGEGGKYSMTTQTEENRQKIDFKLKTKTWSTDKTVENKVNLILHPAPLWDFDFDVGAAKIDFDLSSLRTKLVDIDGGASSIYLKLGDRHNKTRVEVDAGASEVNIKIPEGSGCRVKTSTFLSGKSLSGFNKMDNGDYVTEGYEQADKKIEIKVQAAISDINISRY
ncbi:MAG: cell wall-active antibiotics response protein [Bacteroidales bacterium]|nr:cell wall-active antibiotics response protein [Bacteroidales bacterium]MCF8333149.1 cell wall-active antibiotics response protein [Bacteroidales bacterium]